MSANASKFNALIIKTGTQNIDIDILVNGSTIPTVSSAKLLGVTIDNKLQFDEHVDIVCLKASRQINAIARLSKFLDTSTLRMLYNSFINSNFLFCAMSGILD